jgi:hypothetical protein
LEDQSEKTLIERFLDKLTRSVLQGFLLSSLIVILIGLKVGVLCKPKKDSKLSKSRFSIVPVISICRNVKDEYSNLSSKCTQLLFEMTLFFCLSSVYSDFISINNLSDYTGHTPTTLILTLLSKYLIIILLVTRFNNLK